MRFGTTTMKGPADPPRSGVWELPGILLAALMLLVALPVRGAFLGAYSLDNFTLVNVDADGTATSPDNGLTLIITGGNSGSGLPGEGNEVPGSTYFLLSAPDTARISFHYFYTSFDSPGFDTGGYYAAGRFWALADVEAEADFAFAVAAGEQFGFGVQTVDNLGGPGVLTITNFEVGSSVPEPGTSGPVIAALTVALVYPQRRRYCRLVRRATTSWLSLMLVLSLCCSGLFGQTQFYYNGTDATGRLVRTAVTSATPTVVQRALSARTMRTATAEVHPNVRKPQPRTVNQLLAARAASVPLARSLTVASGASATGFPGLTHYDQRNANNGNQFSVEPPSGEMAVGNGRVLEGVNNAIQVYDVSGAPLLPHALSTNELFGLPPAIDRSTGIYGPFPTDMRVFYDGGMNRWLVLQRAQDYDAAGNVLSSSHLYLAVSQTGDPTGAYNVYTMDTTNATHAGCPCFSDFPQIGADAYGIYISSDEYNSTFLYFAGVDILAISKNALAAGSTTPTVVEFVVPRTTGYEATVRPATTPPGASYFLARGGVEFFLSTQSYFSRDTSFGLWAMTNTASLNTTPSLTLMQTIVPGMAYVYPDAATQAPGPLPYGSTVAPGVLPLLDGGRDSRVLSLVYAGGRLFVTFATQASDDTGRSVVGGAYAVLFPTLRGTTLAAPVWQSGYLTVNNAHVLRPAVGVTAQGKGAIVFTLSGPEYYPSVAFVPVEGFAVGSTAQIAAAGVSPEDGFTAYSNFGVARWGDYSSAAVASDNSIWMTAEYIPGPPRTEAANWGTHVVRYGP